MARYQIVNVANNRPAARGRIFETIEEATAVKLRLQRQRPTTVFGLQRVRGLKEAKAALFTALTNIKESINDA